MGVCMTTRRRQRFIHAQLAWMLATVLLLVILDSLSLDIFFVVSLIGFFVVIELTAPFAVTPRWRSRLKWLVLLGFAVFVSLVAERIAEIMPPGVF